MLHPVTSLLVAFLACWLLREALLPCDFISWALNGHLPYLDLEAELAHVHVPEGVHFDKRLLHPPGVSLANGSQHHDVFLSLVSRLLLCDGVNIFSSEMPPAMSMPSPWLWHTEKPYDHKAAV